MNVMEGEMIKQAGQYVTRNGEVVTITKIDGDNAIGFYNRDKEPDEWSIGGKNEHFMNEIVRVL